MKHPLKRAELEIREAGADVLVHDPIHGKVHVLNGTAGFILQRCDGTLTVDAIVALLGEATGADISRVANDVREALRNFSAMHLLVSDND